jgi:hypothetical protein
MCFRFNQSTGNSLDKYKKDINADRVKTIGYKKRESEIKRCEP